MPLNVPMDVVKSVVKDLFLEIVGVMGGEVHGKHTIKNPNLRGELIH